MLTVENTLQTQFEFERAAAQALLSASAAQRPDLYKKIYAEFYNRFGGAAEERHLDKTSVKSQLGFVEKFLKDGRDTFFEIGSGSGELCIAVSKIAKNCIGVDAAGDRRASAAGPCELHISPGRRCELHVAGRLGRCRFFKPASRASASRRLPDVDRKCIPRASTRRRVRQHCAELADRASRCFGAFCPKAQGLHFARVRQRRTLRP